MNDETTPDPTLLINNPALTAPEPLSNVVPIVNKDKSQKVPVKRKVTVKPAKKPAAKKATSKKPAAKKKAAKKVAPKKAAKPAKEKHVPKTRIGPGMEKFKFDKFQTGKCDVKGCTEKARTPRSHRCSKHFVEVRRAQLKAHTALYRERAAKGNVGNRPIYKGRLTAWAKANPAAAAKLKPAGIAPEKYERLLKAVK